MSIEINCKQSLKHFIIVCIGFLITANACSAQQATSLTLEECYKQAEANYPLLKQRDLIAKTNEYTIDNISKNIYPQLNISGSATYQSDVTRISIPGYNIPATPKDQYKLYGELSQTLTDFGINRQRKEISKADAGLQQENLNTQLYALKDRVNQLFFGVLLIDGQIEQNELSKKDIQTGIDNVQARVNNGTDFNSSLNKLKAQLLQTDQHTIELKASRKAYTDMLNLFINQAVDTNTILIKPSAPTLTDSIVRPELNAYSLQVRSYLLQQKLTRLNLNPKLDAFFQGGVGKPSPVNLLSTDLSGYYVTGIRLNWNFGALYTYKKDKLINKTNQDMVTTQRDNFLFNTKLTMRQQNADIEKYQQLIQSDDAIIKLRQSVKQSSAAQLQNGVITTNDYLDDINAEAQARQDKLLHEVQLLISQYNYKTTAGS